MPLNPLNPLIVQGDRSVLLDVHAPRAADARCALIPFAELEKSPEHLHTYRITPLSLWNAASAGFSPEQVLAVLEDFSRYPVPSNLLAWVSEIMSRFGKITMEVDADSAARTECAVLFGDSDAPAGQKDGEQKGIEQENTGQEDGADFCAGRHLLLKTETANIFREILASKRASKYLAPVPGRGHAFSLDLLNRGVVKQELLRLGWPVQDLAPLKPGTPLAVRLRGTTGGGKPLEVRDYQNAAAQAFVGDNRPGTGFGVIVLPCGSGKTMVGMRVMELLQTETLILTMNTAAVRQWIGELRDKTSLDADSIGEYTGAVKDIKPVTVATYQVLTWRADKDADFPHFNLFRSRSWGLIIYDEVHLLPAPVFRITAEIQAVRRLGLTATLVREDGLESDVFSLVGPKRFDVPWKELEERGWIATARCVEIRVSLPEDLEFKYAGASLREKHRISGENPAKQTVAAALVARHSGEQILIIGQYLEQLGEISAALGVPLITGKTPEAQREAIYADFRAGREKVIVVSKVANFAIDLPDASVAIQVSGSFGSRQEEAQRLGRILRPKERDCVFYTLVTEHSIEEEFAANRQKFLAEQGYEYSILRGSDGFDGDFSL